MEYREYLRSEDWQQKRSVKKAKRRNCAICNAKENLDIHHLSYRNLYDVEQSDLRVLCRSCHFTAHRLHKAGKFRFKNDNHHSRFALIKAAVKREMGTSTRNLFN